MTVGHNSESIVWHIKRFSKLLLQMLDLKEIYRNMKCNENL